MQPTSLTQFYDDLKSQLDANSNDSNRSLSDITKVTNANNAHIWRNKALKCANTLKDKCCKHILLDIYCHILPLDKDYIDGHQGQMKSDIDDMLTRKNLSASQYLTSCYESTRAPLLEFIIRSIDNIGRSYMEDADETLKDAQKNDIAIPDPIEEDPESEKVSDQLVDIKSDTEYDTFMDALKKKTIDKIVNDVSNIINDKKEEKDMTFDPTPNNADSVAATDITQESAVAVTMDYIQGKLFNENLNLSEDKFDEMIGMVIREATLHQLDVVFNQHDGEFKEFASYIRYGNGAIVNESSIQHFKEAAIK